MDSDNESYHSESEFYYLDEEPYFKKTNILETTNSSEDEEMSKIQDFIEAQGPDNTTRKTTDLWNGPELLAFAVKV